MAADVLATMVNVIPKSLTLTRPTQAAAILHLPVLWIYILKQTFKTPRHFLNKSRLNFKHNCSRQSGIIFHREPMHGNILKQAGFRTGSGYLLPADLGTSPFSNEGS